MQLNHFLLLSLLTVTEAISDVNGHIILCGEQYVEVCYLQKRDEKINIVRYQRPKKFQSI